jgi:hypothetical protein
MPISDDKIAAFIRRWSQAESSERANYALFLTELCDVLEVPHPDPAGSDTEANAYVFERAVTFQHELSHRRRSRRRLGIGRKKPHGQTAAFRPALTHFYTDLKEPPPAS